MTDSALYFDYMATTPIDPRVIDVMLEYMGPKAHYGNPSSTTHAYGQTAALAVEHAREQVAATVGASSEEIIFTSGATEANNLAILGAARFYQRKGRHVVTMTTEHKSVLDSMQQLQREGFDVTYLQPESDGLLNLTTLENALREDTILVSLMQVNNEIGVIQDSAAIGELLRGKGVIFHVDAAQSAGRLSIDLRQLSVDLMSFSAHKNYGPKGVGALYVRHRPRIRLQPISFGGGQQQGLRSGTLPTHQIVGMGQAFALTESLRIEEQAYILSLRELLWNGIKHLFGVRLNGSMTHRVAGNLNITFSTMDSERLLFALHELAISRQSACASASSEPSYVLRAIGLSADLAYRTVRLSLGRFSTATQVKHAIDVICHAMTP